MVIGQRIKFFREQAGLKQSELAEKAEISRVAVGNYERGDRVPPVNIAQRIADALGMSVNDLLYPEDLKANAPDILNLDIGELQRKLDARSERISAIVRNFDLLNEAGQDKLVEESNDLTQIPKYKKGNIFRKKMGDE